MEYNSFYGGRPGASFIIAKHFSSVNEMKTEFKKGYDYTDVRFDEYVIIDTFNKNDPSNGEVYRRGYNYSDDNECAIYIGKISGPSGGAPTLEIESYDTVVSDGESSDFSNADTGIYAPNVDLLPGKYIDAENEIQYNDNIQYAWCTITSSDGTQATAKIGFKFPYTVIDFETIKVDPYTNASIERTDDEEHPYYEKWTLSVPQGIPGDDVLDIRVITAADDDNVKITSSYTSEMHRDDVEYERKIIVIEKQTNTDSALGEPEIYYLADYNMVSNINLSNDGGIVFTMTHDDAATFANKIKWLEEVSLLNNGKLNIKYNTEDDTITLNTIKWIDNVALADNGSLTIKYNTEENNTELGTIKWVEDINLANNGSLTTKYNTEEDRTDLGTIKWIENVNLNNNGILTTKYNTENNPTELGTIQSIKKAELDTDYRLKITYNTVDDNGNPNVYTSPTIRAANGILIGTNKKFSDINSSRTPTDTEINTYLKANIGNGYENGKIVTITDDINELTLNNVKYYAYDYLNQKWYCVGSVDNATVNFAGAVSTYENESRRTQSEQDTLEALGKNSLWFIIDPGFQTIRAKANTVANIDSSWLTRSAQYFSGISNSFNLYLNYGSESYVASIAADASETSGYWIWTGESLPENFRGDYEYIKFYYTDNMAKYIGEINPNCILIEAKGYGDLPLTGVTITLTSSN